MFPETFPAFGFEFSYSIFSLCWRKLLSMSCSCTAKCLAHFCQAVLQLITTCGVLRVDFAFV